MNKRTPIYRTEDLPRTGANGPVIQYTMSREEIQAKYGHIQPYDPKTKKTLATTADQHRPIMFKTGGLT